MMLPARLRSLAFSSSVLLTLAYSSYSQNASAPPVSVSVKMSTGQLASQQLAKLQRKNKLSVYSAASMDGRLFLATSAGIVEFDEHGILSLMRVGDSVWSDPANHAIWTLDFKGGRLLRLRNSQWQAFHLPDNPNLNRQDWLHGPSLSGNEHGLWMTWGGIVWRWEDSAQQWKPLTSAREGSDRAIAILPLGASPLVIHGRSDLIRNIGDARRGTDEVLDTANPDLPVRNRAGNFYAKSWASTQNAGYVCTSAHKLLRITREEITSISTPGPCQSVSADFTAGLIASFEKSGIFQYTDDHQWHLLANTPPLTGHFTLWVASNGNQVVLGTLPEELVTEGTGNSKFYNDMRGGIWFSQNGDFLPVP